MTQEELLLEKLKSINGRASGLDTPRSFFFTLYEFVDEFDSNPLLEPINIAMRNMAEKDNAYLRDQEGKALEEMGPAYKEILGYVEKNKIETPAVLKSLNDYLAYEEGRIQSTSGPIIGRHGALMYALISLMGFDNSENRDFVDRFAELDNEKRVVRWKISQSFDLWEQEQKRLDRINPTRPWYSWDKIVFFYQIYKDYEKMRDERLKNHEYINAMGINDMFRELNDVMDYKTDHKRYLRIFDVGEYKIHLERVYLFTRGLLLQPMVDGTNTKGGNQSYSPKSTIDNILATQHFGKQEESFIKKLSDLKPHNVGELKKISRDPKHLKGRVSKKLENTPFKIVTTKGNGLTDSSYQFVPRQ